MKLMAKPMIKGALLNIYMTEYPIHSWTHSTKIENLQLPAQDPHCRWTCSTGDCVLPPGRTRVCQKAGRDEASKDGAMKARTQMNQKMPRTDRDDKMALQERQSGRLTRRMTEKGQAPSQRSQAEPPGLPRGGGGEKKEEPQGRSQARTENMERMRTTRTSRGSVGKDDLIITSFPFLSACSSSPGFPRRFWCATASFRVCTLVCLRECARSRFLESDVARWLLRLAFRSVSFQ